MWETIHKIFMEVALTGLWIFHLIIHGEEFIEKFDKLAGIKKWIVRRIVRRKGDQNMSLATVINGIALAEKDALALSTFMANVPKYLPAIQKQLADIQQAAADEKNPVALAGDVSTLLTDLSTDMALIAPMIQNLLPALKATTPPAAA